MSDVTKRWLNRISDIELGNFFTVLSKTLREG